MNSDRFLQAFNRIEKHLRRKVQEDKFGSFGALVRNVEKRDRTVRRYAVDLHEFADLRNAIVHESTDSHVIAEPNERTVREIEALALALVKPPEVAPSFIHGVVSLSETASIGEAVALMQERDYSQIPITKQETFHGLLTNNTIVRWLGASVKNDILSLSETSVAEVLTHEEASEGHVFIGRDATLFDVLDAFEHARNTGKVLSALLITHSGKSHEKIVGIVTASDLPTVLGSLDLTDRSRD